MKLKIKEPCHEDWNKMNSNEPQIGLHTRHCDSCEKSVMDFTQNSRAEIIAFMLSNQDKSICGRMRPDQFDFRHEDIPMLITTMQRQRTANPFLILSLVCMSLGATAQEDLNHIKTPPPVKHQVKMGKMIAQPVEPVELGDIAIEEVITTKGEVVRIDPDPPIEQPMVGQLIAPFNPENCSAERVYQYSEKMPEFCGGLSAMTSYFSENVNYSTKTKAQGTVYVRFVVEKDGSIARPELIRGIDPILDQEALRVVTEMPPWNPGEQRGEEVPVYMTIPVRFVK